MSMNELRTMNDKYGHLVRIPANAMSCTLNGSVFSFYDRMGELLTEEEDELLAITLTA